MGSWDWASRSRIAKHLSTAGTLFDAGGIIELIPFHIINACSLYKTTVVDVKGKTLLTRLLIPLNSPIKFI
jgi:hypothetical protein